VSATRFLPFLLGGLTLIVLFANALPAAQRKHRLQREHRELVDRCLAAIHERDELALTIEALRHDAFTIERVCAETWCVAPDGAISLRDLHAPAARPTE